MKYNLEYLNLHYGLSRIFLIDAEPSILDISYHRKESILDIQVIMLEGHKLTDIYFQKLEIAFPKLVPNIHVIYLTKKEFNENKGDWRPTKYSWLKHVLFAKAEII